MADELKPCPFCGADESYQCSRSATVGAATAWRCSKCGANGPYVERDGGDAALIRAWNRRAPSSAPAVDPREVCARPCDVLALNSLECECCESMARSCAASIRALPPFAAQHSESVKRLVEAARILSDWEYRLGDAAFEAKYPGVERHKIVVRFNDALAAVEKEMGA